MNPDIPQALYEKEAGRLVLKYAQALPPEELLEKTNTEALDLISQIKAILDDDTVEDPECFRRIEAIINAFREKGIDTFRHDW